MVSADVYPPGALHHARPLQDVVVGLPLHLVLEGTQLALGFCISQISCRGGRRTKTCFNTLSGQDCRLKENNNKIKSTG